MLFVGTVRDVNDGRASPAWNTRAYRIDGGARAGRHRARSERRVRDAATSSSSIALGALELGDASVAIAVAHPHRGAAYDASRYVIEQLKQRVPIWKLEHYVDGTREWVDASGAKSRARRPARATTRRRVTMTPSPTARRRLRDQFGRSIEYLRISVTDRCNFRCVYCMPETGMQWLPKSEILSYEEIADVVRQLAPLGLRRLRITGGEPTIRPQIHELDSHAARGSARSTDIALSTNGVRLPELARAAARVGLDRVNMSVDSLRADRIVAHRAAQPRLRSGARRRRRRRTRDSIRSSSTWS